MHQDLTGRHVLFLNWRDTGHPEGGGSEVYVEQMAVGLAERGAVVHMVCPRYPGAPKRELKDGIHYYRIGGRLSIYLLVPLLNLFHRLPRHDLVVEIQNGVPFLAAAYLTTPVVVVVHHVHREQWPIVFHPLVARFGWWLEGTLAPKVALGHQYVTVSTATKTELVSLGVRESDIAVIRNGSPHGSEVKQGPRSQTPEVLALGRLVPHKQVEIAIESLADIPDARLTIAGEGWWHTHLSERASQLGVTDRVTFTGHVSEEEKNMLFSRAWVQALPSLKEGWGLVIVEAGMHQTPTVAFHSAGGVQESIVDGETGFLVEDNHEFTERLRELLEDHALRERMGTNAERHARTFTWEASQEAFATVASRHLR